MTDGLGPTGGQGDVPTGCFNCGRPGHWGRDCPANPSSGKGGDAGKAEVGSKTRVAGRTWGNGGKNWSGGGAQTGQSGFQKKNSVKEPLKKEPKKRPKLTADLLLSEYGLGYVLEKMPQIVDIKAREDSVVEDLKALLEGYMHWHSLILPYFSFDQFVEKVEKLGASKRVRICTRELRDKIEYGGKAFKGETAIESEVDSEISPTELQQNEASVDSEKGADGSNPDDVFACEEDDMPLNNEDFEDFFRQGVEHDIGPPSTILSSVAPEQRSDVSLVSSSRPVAYKGDVPGPVSGSMISESARALMEANRLKALERARARRESREGFTASGLPSEYSSKGGGPSLASDVGTRTVC